MDKELYYVMCQIAQSLITVFILYTLLVSLPLWIDSIKSYYKIKRENRIKNTPYPSVMIKDSSGNNRHGIITYCSCDKYFLQYGIHDNGCKELNNIPYHELVSNNE